MTFAGAFLVVVYLVRFLLFICARIFVCEGKMVFRLLAHLLICILPVRPVCLATVLTIVEMDDFVTNIFCRDAREVKVRSAAGILGRFRLPYRGQPFALGVQQSL